MSQSQCPGSPSQAPYPYALVSRYPTNKLIGHRPLLEQQERRNAPAFHTGPCDPALHPELAHLSTGYAELEGRLSVHY